MDTSQKFEKKNGETVYYNEAGRKDGRRTGRKRKGWQVSEMWDRHHEVARMLVLGWKNREIAEVMGMSEKQVSSIKNSPVVQDRIACIHATRDVATIDLKEEIMTLAPIAVQRLREALEEGTVLGKDLNGTAILKEANNMLDREMGKAIQRVDQRNATVHFTAEDLDKIKERAKQMGIESEQIAV